MDPFTMLLGYGLVNSLSQLVIRPIADKMGASGRYTEMKNQIETKHTLDLTTIRFSKQIELEYQKNIQDYSHKYRVNEAQEQFNRQLQMWQIGNFNDKMWPLLTPYDHPSLRPSYTNSLSVPINIFLAKTDPRSPFNALIQPDLKNRLSNFLQTYYFNDPQQQHPCICRIGDWKDGFQDAAFINALWYGMQGQPTIVINPIQSEFGEILDLNVSIWGLGEMGYTPKTQNVLSCSFGSAIGRIKREKTLNWKNCELPIASKEMEHNINLLKQEENIISSGNAKYIDKLLTQYQLPREIQNEVITEFSREYNHVISCITGMFADIYHLIEYGAPPYMPIAVNLYNKMTGNKYQIPDIVIQHYRKTLTNMACTNYLQDKLPYVFLGVAKSLSYNPTFSQEVLQEGVCLWANKKIETKKEIEIPESIDECVKILYDNSSDGDKKYLEKVKEVLLAINQEDAANSLNKKISIIVDKTETRDFTSESIEWGVIKEEIFTDIYFQNWIDSNRKNISRYNAKYAIILMRENYFAMMFLNLDMEVFYCKELPRLCVIANKHYLPNEICNCGTVIYNLHTNDYEKPTKNMNKEKFNSFERLGKQLDSLINNLEIVSKSTQEKYPDNNEKKNDLDLQLTQVFTESNYLSLESEQCDVANFISIKNWITSKVPLQGASNAHVFRTNFNAQIVIGIFFSDKEYNSLIGNSYPMKKIICHKCDSDIEAFLNGLSIGTINI